jgi:hypothetical protein
MNSKAQDTIATLKLYELRREPTMREARDWFIWQFKPENAREIIKLMTNAQEKSAFYRMVTTYWEMAAAFVNEGGIDAPLFIAANSEFIVVYVKVQPYLAEVRQMINEPDYLEQLEKLVMKVPNISVKLENRQKMLTYAARSKMRENELREST